VPKKSLWEHDHIHIAGLVVSNYIDTPFHVQSTMTLGAWLQQERVPALEIKDTRLLTQHIRTYGAMLGKIIFEQAGYLHTMTPGQTVTLSVDVGFGPSGAGAPDPVAGCDNGRHHRPQVQEVAPPFDPQRLIVSAGALTLPDMTALAAHATQQGVAGVLLMPPCMYRGGIGDDGTFRFYATVIDRVASDALRLYLYHFPDISGVPVTTRVIRRLSEKYGPVIAGVKDSGGDFGFTEDVLRRFSHLAVYTGSETHVPSALAAGARGTICGLANVIARLMRTMSDAPTLPDRRRYVPSVQAVDSILSRGPFIPSIKAVIAEAMQQPAWRRVIPPMAELPLFDENRLLADFGRLAAAFPR
jgi:4-hydroxy-tetrahydrodipicolinate synthase